MNDVLMETLIDKVGSLEGQIGALKEKMEGLPDYGEALEKIGSEIHGLGEQEPPLPYPEREVRQLIANLRETTHLLRQPVKKEVTHHHYVPKLIWISAGLFLAFCLVCSGWYHTGSKLSQYVANDTKYRYLKLNGNKPLQQILFITDSLYGANAGMRDSVISREEENERKLQLLQQAADKQQEVDELRRKAKK